MKDKEKQREYYIKNKEKIILQQKEYYKLHPDKRKEALQKQNKRSKQYYYKKVREYNKTHKEQVKIQRRKRYLKNRTKIIQMVRNYQKTSIGKLISRKTSAKRRNELEYNNLNQIFEGSDGHHLDPKNVIFVPKELHKSVGHRQNDEESMKCINILAWDFMESQVY